MPRDLGRNVRCALLLLMVAVPGAAAQTSPVPADATGATGFLSRSAWLFSVAAMKSGDPRFAWTVHGQLDLDLVGYRKGRINLLMDNEVVMGREHREFDFNHQNIIFETSYSYRVASIEVAGVFHHTSRHVIDRAFDRVVAWHTAGVRAMRTFVRGRTKVGLAFEAHDVVQHTYVDYSWTGQGTIRAERSLGSGGRVYASGAAATIGVDDVLDRDPQWGARGETGIRVSGERAAFELFGAYERRIDGFPTARVPSSWIEGGFRLASR